MAYFNDESYRHGDPGCASLVDAMQYTLSSSTMGGGRGAGSYAGLSVYAPSSQIRHGVWLHDDIFGSQVTYLERFRVVVHEAAHLAFFSDDETFADNAAEYCIGQSQVNPFGGPL